MIYINGIQATKKELLAVLARSATARITARTEKSNGSTATFFTILEF